MNLQARLAGNPGAMLEGEGPEFTHEDDMALIAFNFVSNGMGGIDFSGIELIAAKLGIEDIDGLLDRLLTIKTHRPPDDNSPFLD